MLTSCNGCGRLIDNGFCFRCDETKREQTRRARQAMAERNLDLDAAIADRAQWDARKATQAQVEELARVGCEESFPSSDIINPQDLMD